MLTDVQFVTADVLPGPEASLVFNVTVVNSQSDGYDIPASLSGYPNFDFKVRIAMFVKEKCIQPIDLFLLFKYFICLICRF